MGGAGLAAGQQVVVVVKGGEEVLLPCPLWAGSRNSTRSSTRSSTLSWYQRKEQRVLLVLSSTLTPTLTSTLTPTLNPTMTPRPRLVYGRGFGPDRFTLHPRQPGDLLLLRPQPGDAGVYFCCVSRRTKIT